MNAAGQVMTVGGAPVPSTINSVRVSKFYGWSDFKYTVYTIKSENYRFKILNPLKLTRFLRPTTLWQILMSNKHNRKERLQLLLIKVQITTLIFYVRTQKKYFLKFD